MNQTDLGIVAAFGAGIVSFLSPCVLPLVPAYLSYLAGASLREGQTSPTARWRVTAHAVFFVLGFALIFAMLGAVASAVGAVLNEHRLLVERGAGVLLVLFGIVMTGLVPLPFLQQERRVHLDRGEPALVRSALIGMAFAAGWSPCIGPVLGSIFALAATSTTLGQGVLLLLVYAMGLGLPFLLVALLIDRAGAAVHRLNRYTRPVSLIGGVVLALTGLLVLTGQLAQLANYAPLITL